MEFLWKWLKTLAVLVNKGYNLVVSQSREKR